MAIQLLRVKYELPFNEIQDWRLYVPLEEYYTFVTGIEGRIALKQATARGWLTHSDLAAIWEASNLEDTMMEASKQAAKVVFGSTCLYLVCLATLLATTHSLQMASTSGTTSPSASPSSSPMVSNMDAHPFLHDPASQPSYPDGMETQNISLEWNWTPGDDCVWNWTVTDNHGNTPGRWKGFSSGTLDYRIPLLLETEPGYRAVDLLSPGCPGPCNKMGSYSCGIGMKHPAGLPGLEHNAGVPGLPSSNYRSSSDAVQTLCSTCSQKARHSLADHLLTSRPGHRRETLVLSLTNYELDCLDWKELHSRTYEHGRSNREFADDYSGTFGNVTDQEAGPGSSLGGLLPLGEHLWPSGSWDTGGLGKGVRMLLAFA